MTSGYFNITLLWWKYTQWTRPAKSGIHCNNILVSFTVLVRCYKIPVIMQTQVWKSYLRIFNNQMAIKKSGKCIYYHSRPLQILHILASRILLYLSVIPMIIVKCILYYRFWLHICLGNNHCYSTCYSIYCWLWLKSCWQPYLNISNWLVQLGRQ